jgi:hypothetical protein
VRKAPSACGEELFFESIFRRSNRFRRKVWLPLALGACITTSEYLSALNAFADVMVSIRHETGRYQEASEKKAYEKLQAVIKFKDLPDESEYFNPVWNAVFTGVDRTSVLGVSWDEDITSGHADFPFVLWPFEEPGNSATKTAKFSLQTLGDLKKDLTDAYHTQLSQQGDFESADKLYKRATTIFDAAPQEPFSGENSAQSYKQRSLIELLEAARTYRKSARWRFLDSATRQKNIKYEAFWRADAVKNACCAADAESIGNFLEAGSLWLQFAEDALLAPAVVYRPELASSPKALRGDADVQTFQEGFSSIVAGLQQEDIRNAIDTKVLAALDTQITADFRHDLELWKDFSSKSPLEINLGVFEAVLNALYQLFPSRTTGTR